MKKKIICFVPIKKISERIKNKNFQMLGKKPLYKHIIDKLIKIKDFDKVVIDTDSKEIQNFCIKKKIFFIKRKKLLAKKNANGNDLLKYWIQLEPDYDFYFQVHVTSPFVKIESIRKCINFLKFSKKFNSIFTATKDYSWYWFKKKPVNFKKFKLTRSQDLDPLIRDITFLYGISKKEFLKRNSRIGSRPYALFLTKEESIDINENLDLKFSRFFIRSK